jgi:ribosomal protein S18 acetylase RimI-like enzyme
MIIREAQPRELDALGQLMVSVYSNIAGFPGPDEQPEYYARLANIGELVGQVDTQLLVAVDGEALLGGVVYFASMTRYGTTSTAAQETGASSFRWLAVAQAARGLGVGKALVNHCIDLARQHGNRQVIIHTTTAQHIAWGMYEAMGFVRSPDLDFSQGELSVHGFRLAL